MGAQHPSPFALVNWPLLSGPAHSFDKELVLDLRTLNFEIA